MTVDSQRTADLLEYYHDKYNRPDFIEHDPISIPHRYSKKQDIEIMGLFATVLAWGQRITIINNCRKISDWMDDDPHRFICQHESTDLRKMEKFVHRTFNSTDLLYFIEFLKQFYAQHDSLEEAFLCGQEAGKPLVQSALETFREGFFSLETAPKRTGKHIASPAKNSSCKRMNMYLRWMVRKDDRGVDFGLWESIPMAALHCPLDVHVERMGRHLGLLHRKQRDWKAVMELTKNLRKFDLDDPVRFDFALFGMGLEERHLI